MAKNLNLHKASAAKQDEFYTQKDDIENEMKHYKEQFRGKVIYCNCDDPYESEFFKYFTRKFNNFNLEKLIATSYVNSPIQGKQLNLLNVIGLAKQINNNKHPYRIAITEVDDKHADDIDYLLRNKRNVLTLLKGDGDFRSPECVELLRQADVVVTNPPFSLFREYVAQLIEYRKGFVIIGNTNAITYKEIFKLFQQDKIRTGYTNFNVGMFFIVPSNWERFHHIDENGNKIVRVSTSSWFTNLEVEKHRQNIKLYEEYNPKKYPKYDNYDAINVNIYTDIPKDYDGAIGVPITFLDKYNPKQFKIIKFRKGDDNKDLAINGKYPYFRIIVQRIGAIQ